MASERLTDCDGADVVDDRDETDCVVGQAWCPGPESEALPCISCWLRRDRDDDPHPAVAAVADARCGRDRDRDVADDNSDPDG